MRAVVQRVLHAKVHAGGEQIAAVGRGLVILLGLAQEDTVKDARWMAAKCADLRIFDDAQGVMNLSVRDIGGEILLISQFTLLGDARRGRRPSYQEALSPDSARELFSQCVEIFRETYGPVKTGRFQADMQVALVNDGPVTILLDSRKRF